MTTRTRLAVVLAAVLTATLTYVVPQAGIAGAVPLKEQLQPSEGALFGAWVKPEGGGSIDAIKNNLTDFEAGIGRKLDVVHSFYQWNATVPSWREPWLISRGQTPLVSLHGTDNNAIVRGTHDALLRSRADALRDLGQPVMLRFLWEMDGRIGAETGVTSPAGFIEAWRHAHRLFAEQGATNVAWVWCPTAWGFQTGEAQKYYPGDDYVDWICADGYNWAPVRPNTPSRTFSEIYQSFYDWASTRGKPLMVGEFGALERQPGDKAAWIDDAGEVLKTQFPAIDAVVYFNALKYEKAEGASFDWRVSTSASAHKAYSNMGADPYFNPRTNVPSTPGDGTPEDNGGGGADSPLPDRRQLEPSQGALFGAWVKPEDGWGMAEQQQSLTDFETGIGRQLDVVHSYYQWDATVPSWREPWLISRGQTPLVSLHGTDNNVIVRGTHDALLRSRADALRDLGQPLMLRFLWEMDGRIGAETGVTSPAGFTEAWRHAHRLFAEQGATNVAWVWCPTAWGFETGEAQKYYPGDDYVDWICADGYNWAPARPNTPSRSFSEIYQSFYDWASTRGKPLMVGEFGALERQPGDKAAWIDDAREVLKTQFPAIDAVVYFNAIMQENAEGATFDWRVSTSASAHEAYSNMGADPYFNP